MDRFTLSLLAAFFFWLAPLSASAQGCTASNGALDGPYNGFTFVNPLCDYDNDGSINALDNCAMVWNVVQMDSNSDGIGDVCSTFPVGPEYDTDGDGLVDPIDNCVFLANTIQTDTDNDGWGNICDPDFDQSGFVTTVDCALVLAQVGAPVAGGNEGLVMREPIGGVYSPAAVSFTDVFACNAYVGAQMNTGNLASWAWGCDPTASPATPCGLGGLGPY